MSPLKQRALVYPTAQPDATVTEYHGVSVADSYRWLEQADDPHTQQWTAAQQQLTDNFLASLPYREQVRARLRGLWDVSKRSVPFKRGQRYFFLQSSGLQHHPILYCQNTLGDEPYVVLDPNKLSDDGTVAITNYTISRDGTRVTYCVSHQGSEWQMIQVLDTITLQVLPDRIEWCKFADIAWKHDSSGFFYSRMLAPDEVTDPVHRNRNRIYWHTLGTPQSADQLIYECPEAPDLCFSPIVSSDEAYLILDVWQGTRLENQLYYREMNSTASFTPLIDTADASYTFIATIGTILYVHTNLDAPRGRVIAIDIERPQQAYWYNIISEQTATLAQATLVQNRLVVVYTCDVQHHVHVYHLDGSLDRILDIPPHSAVVGLAGFIDDNEIFLAVESFLDARTILRHVVGGQEVERVTQTHVDFPLSDYRTEQITYRSPDGTSIPMYVVHHKELQLDGSNPVLLTGYGGFGISMMPSFMLPWLPWLEIGGVYVVANIRGGGEYGEEWHRAGMGQYRQHVFDDFIAAAEWLIAAGYTCREKLVIYGNSNGGLLVATCMVQRPNLFGAVICQAPLTDMLRYHHFTVGSYWIPEYGCADDPEDFASLYAYSPLHNIRPDVNYPACLVLTADTDDRVVPAHAKKFVATLQASSNGEHPLLLRVEHKAGHGQGKPTAKVIDEYSDIYAFLFHALLQR